MDSVQPIITHLSREQRDDLQTASLGMDNIQVLPYCGEQYHILYQMAGEEYEIKHLYAIELIMLYHYLAKDCNAKFGSSLPYDENQISFCHGKVPTWQQHYAVDKFFICKEHAGYSINRRIWYLDKNGKKDIESTDILTDWMTPKDIITLTKSIGNYVLSRNILEDTYKRVFATFASEVSMGIGTVVEPLFKERILQDAAGLIAKCHLKHFNGHLYCGLKDNWPNWKK